MWSLMSQSLQFLTIQGCIKPDLSPAASPGSFVSPLLAERAGVPALASSISLLQCHVILCPTTSESMQPCLRYWGFQPPIEPAAS